MSTQESGEPPVLNTVREHMRTPIATWAERLEAGLDRFLLGETAFRAYTDVPSEASDEVVVIGGEHGNSFWAQHDKSKPNPAIVRAHILRDAIDRQATLVYLAGNSVGEDNFNFTAAEQAEMESGSVSPVVNRWHAVLESLPNSAELRRGTGIGLSLGATVLSSVMRFGATPLNSAVYVEAPNIRERTTLELMNDFWKSGKHLAENIRLNADPSESEVAAEHIKSVNPLTVRGAIGMGKFVAGVTLLSSNRALVPAMLQPSLEPAISASLAQKQKVVHAWGTQDDVSPAGNNRLLQQVFERDENYTPFEMDGKHADHSITNIYGLMGALVTLAAR